ncbi:hypothetical protein GGX14DRAFT_386723 [Mycena pura]|uniref:Uncharacterized protein n=1 Tax=Mycena pura TaxID=153505 RepID=A0AAD6YQC6_9AGAR|nr:hypothetical protein GGX14DRAFT_386723 [Mycena pura]
MQCLQQTCSTLYKHILLPTHIVLLGGGFSLHPDLSQLLTNVVPPLDRLLDLALRNARLPGAQSFCQKELQVLTCTTGLEIATQNPIVWNWIHLVDKVYVAMVNLKSLRYGRPLNSLGFKCPSRMCKTLESLPLQLLIKLPSDFLHSYVISVTKARVAVHQMAQVHEHGSMCSWSPLHGSQKQWNSAEAGGLTNPPATAPGSSVKSFSPAAMGPAARVQTHGRSLESARTVTIMVSLPERSSLSTVGPDTVTKAHSPHTITDSIKTIETLATGHAPAAARPAAVKDLTDKSSCTLPPPSACISVAVIDKAMDKLGGLQRDLCRRAEYPACGHHKAVQLPAPANVLGDDVVELGGLNTEGTKRAVNSLELEDVINHQQFTAQKKNTRTSMSDTCGRSSVLLQAPSPAATLQSSPVVADETTPTVSLGPGVSGKALTTGSSPPVVSPSFSLLVSPATSDYLDFVLVSAILWITWMSYLARIICENAAPCIAWAREGIETHTWN